MPGRIAAGAPGVISFLQQAVSPVAGARIWRAQLDELSEAEIANWHAHLDPKERERATRFHFERDRNHFISARGLLRELLGEILHEPAPSLTFSYGEHGKPALRHSQPIDFNLSHSAGWAMFAVADREVGIDLESAGRLDQDEDGLARLAARVLSARELEFWRAIPEQAERRAMFLRAWTRKEAYAKATGRGIFDSLAKLEVIPEAENALTSGWLIRDLDAPAGFTAALAIRQS